MRTDLYADLFKEEDTHWWHVAKRKIIIELLNKYLKSKKGNKVLDIGCGTGKNMEALSVFGETYGADPSGDALDFAKFRGLKNLIQARANDLATEGSFFDVVTMLDVLEHIDEEALQEVSRTLKDEGLLVIHVPAYAWLWSKWDEILHHKRRYTKTSLNAALNKFGFETVFSSYHFSYLVLPAYVVRFIKSKIKKEGEYTSDFQNSNFLIQNIFTFLSAIERFLILFGFSVPFGTSVICLAKKKLS